MYLMYIVPRENTPWRIRIPRKDDGLRVMGKEGDYDVMIYCPSPGLVRALAGGNAR